MKLNENQMSALNIIVAESPVRVIDLSGIYTSTLASLIARDLIMVVATKIKGLTVKPTTHAKPVVALNNELNKLNLNYKEELSAFAIRRRDARKGV